MSEFTVNRRIREIYRSGTESERAEINRMARNYGRSLAVFVGIPFGIAAAIFFNTHDPFWRLVMGIMCLVSWVPLPFLIKRLRRNQNFFLEKLERGELLKHENFEIRRRKWVWRLPMAAWAIAAFSDFFTSRDLSFAFFLRWYSLKIVDWFGSALNPFFLGVGSVLILTLPFILIGIFIDYSIGKKHYD